MSAARTWVEKMRCCLIAERAQCRGELLETVEAALRAGVRAVQLREKQATAREVFELARPLRELTHRHDALLLINDRFDIALALGADGVHLGWQSLAVAEVRRLLLAGGTHALPTAKRLLVGRSVHNLDEARQAASAGADYLLAGPVFATPSKAGVVPTLGLDRLRELCSAISQPVVALGGIGATNAAACLAAGAVGVSVIRAILAAEDPGKAAQRLLASMSKR